MLDLPQPVINGMFTAFIAIGGGGVGYLLRSFNSLREADAKLTDKVHDLAVLVAGLQQAQADTQEFRADVRQQLKYIIERIDKQ